LDKDMGRQKKDLTYRSRRPASSGTEIRCLAEDKAHMNSAVPCYLGH
jgi:hypothetical protein